MTKWICSQFGARENYAIPRALSLRGALDRLYTDVWLNPSMVVSKFMPNARFHSDLVREKVSSFNSTFLPRHFARMAGIKTQPDDGLYDQLVAGDITRKGSEATNLFAYSYSSLNTMRSARAQGYRTFLGQINPGPAEAEIVKEAFAAYRNGKYPPAVPDEAYWEQWRLEVQASDRIIVNSTWSSDLLMKSGVNGKKIVVVPLAYAPGKDFTERQFATKFDHGSPLKLLYLGSVGIRKGFHVLSEAMALMESMPVTLEVVGGLKGPRELLAGLGPNVHYHGYVGKSGVEDYFAKADALIFPSLSDGFGLVQLEAQARKLPLIASSNCASVVAHMTNGLVLKEVTATAIIEAVTTLIDRPELLPKFSASSVSMKDYDLAGLADRLTSIE